MERQELRSESPWGQTIQALIARLKSLGWLLKASGAVSVGWAEMHSGRCPGLQKVAYSRGWRRSTVCPGTGLGGRVLEVPTVWWSQDTCTDQLCPMLLVLLHKWEEGQGQYFLAERQELTLLSTDCVLSAVSGSQHVLISAVPIKPLEEALGLFPFYRRRV